MAKKTEKQSIIGSEFREGKCGVLPQMHGASAAWLGTLLESLDGVDVLLEYGAGSGATMASLVANCKVKFPTILAVEAPLDRKEETTVVVGDAAHGVKGWSVYVPKRYSLGDLVKQLAVASNVGMVLAWPYLYGEEDIEAIVALRPRSVFVLVGSKFARIPEIGNRIARGTIAGTTRLWNEFLVPLQMKGSVAVANGAVTYTLESLSELILPDDDDLHAPTDVRMGKIYIHIWIAHRSDHSPVIPP